MNDQEFRPSGKCSAPSRVAITTSWLFCLMMNSQVWFGLLYWINDFPSSPLKTIWPCFNLSKGKMKSVSISESSLVRPRILKIFWPVIWQGKQLSNESHLTSKYFSPTARTQPSSVSCPFGSACCHGKWVNGAPSRPLKQRATKCERETGTANGVNHV